VSLFFFFFFFPSQQRRRSSGHLLDCKQASECWFYAHQAKKKKKRGKPKTTARKTRQNFNPRNNAPPHHTPSAPRPEIYIFKLK
jgi:hypothetical protein